MYKYLIEADSISKAEFIRQVLLNYGFCYDWEVQEKVDITSFVKIAIFKTKERKQKILDLIITNNSEYLQNLGLEPIVRSTFPKSTYVIKSRNKEGKNVFLLHRQCITPFRILNERWRADAFINNISGLSCISVIKKQGSKYSIVVGLDLADYISRSMLGPSKCISEQFTDWSQIYGYSQTQEIASTCHVDNVINFILDYLLIYGGRSIPGRIHSYPPGLSAPVLITGDTDSATEEDLQKYCDLMTSNRVHSTLLVKNFSPFSNHLVISLLNKGHSFGIHPYSENSTFDEFNDNFNSLCEQLYGVSKKKPFGVRNHRFQLINRDFQIMLENNRLVDFDLNCVAASGRTWIGSGSGLGQPLPFWDNERGTLSTILQLPTIIEDDVFIYDFDYCYKPYKTGVYLSIDLCIEFLKHWIFEKKLPCCINLHPEHIKPEYPLLIYKIVSCLFEKGIWAPNLDEFSSWIKKRNSTKIHVNNQATIVDTEIAVEFLEKKGFRHFCNPGTRNIGVSYNE
jgi:hypothetical protein